MLDGRPGDRRRAVVPGRSPAGSPSRRCSAAASTDTLSGLGPPAAARRRRAAARARAAGEPPAPVGRRRRGAAARPDRRQPSSAAGLAPRARAPTGSPTRRSRRCSASPYTVSPMSNRVGARLTGAALTRAEAGELPSEGIVLGAVQVPADGQPLVFLADHPTTGGYPVIGVVDDVTPARAGPPGHYGHASMDLNADLGEGFGAWRLGDDEALLDVVTTANVACGFHAGDPATMRRVCAAAAERGVAVGAQVGYRDLAGFGRRRIEYAFADLRDDVLYQIGALDGVLPGRRHRGALRQAARRALQHGRRRRGAGRGGGGGGRRLRPVAAGALPARLGARPARGRRRAARRSARASPTAATGRTDALVPRSAPGALVRRPGGGRRPRGADGRRAASVESRRRRRSCRRRSSRSACTATPRARSTWPGGCARRWRRPGVAVAPFAVVA